MDKVKEEFFLSLIFILKWLSLGLGMLGILYFAISLAYHKSYYDPLIKEYDIEISELHKEKADIETSLNTLQTTLDRTQTKIDVLEKTDIPSAENIISLQEKKIESLDESIIDKYNPFSDRNDEARQLYKEKDKAVDHKDKLEDRLQDLFMTKAVKEQAKEEMLNKIDQIDILLSVKEHEKEKVGTGALGVFPWLLGILGLT